MVTSINRKSPIPYYIQVQNKLTESINQGQWRPGDKLPGEHQLCEMFNVSRTVIRQALDQLEQEKIIYREKGRGTFVAQPTIKKRFVQNLIGFYEDMVEQGYTVFSKMLRLEVIPAKSTVAGKLEIEPNTKVIYMERLRFVDDEPITLTRTYLPYDLCPQVIDADFSYSSLYAFIENECALSIARGIRIIEAVSTTEYESKNLQIPVGSPLILIKSISYQVDGTPLEYYEALHRGDRSQFEVELVRMKS